MFYPIFSIFLLIKTIIFPFVLLKSKIFNTFQPCFSHVFILAFDWLFKMLYTIGGCSLVNRKMYTTVASGIQLLGQKMRNLVSNKHPDWSKNLVYHSEPKYKNCTRVLSQLKLCFHYEIG